MSTLFLSREQIDEFYRCGFLVLRSLVNEDLVEELLEEIRGNLEPLREPVEFEADVGYPGAPAGRESEGGKTPRRLLQALRRSEIFERVLDLSSVKGALKDLLGADSLLVSRNHHNCVMTKYPGFSSETNWHQDIRYWSFERPELISVWFSLGEENVKNGGLRIIPGSHKRNLSETRLDDRKFLRTDLTENQRLIQQAEEVKLSRGDVLFFHCKVFHAAASNGTDLPKFSPVFTVHTIDNEPSRGTRSAELPGYSIC